LFDFSLDKPPPVSDKLSARLRAENDTTTVMATNESQNPPGTPPAAGPTPLWRRTPVQAAGVLALAAAFYFGLDLLVFSFAHETTDNAFIAGHTVSVAPRIAGQVAAVPVQDNQLVHSNDLLVEIDPAGYAITVSQKRAAVASQDANVKTVFAVDELMRKKVATAEAGARKAKADADAIGAGAHRAQEDFQRMEELLKQKTISSQEFDAAQAANRTAQADLAAARESVSVEDSKVDEARTQLVAAEAEVGLATSQWQEAQTNVASAELDFSYTKIFAPCDGRVTRKAVESGNYVQAGQQLLSLVQPDIWVVANFKETQLRDIRTNQPVEITVDSFGGKAFAGHVESIQAGSGAAFSLLPPENAVGNYVKVVQRIPVKIVFDAPLDAAHVLGPGMSVVPAVRTSGFGVPKIVLAVIAVVLALVGGFFWRRAARQQPAG
jgi:membrane fusion protein (multidrug efflux system)